MTVKWRRAVGEIIKEESGLRFAFPESWRVTAYDDQKGGENPFFKDRLNCCLSGVDLLATSDDGPLLLIEVKNFMGDNWSSNEYRFSDAETESVIAVKKFVKNNRHPVSVRPKKSPLVKEFAKNVTDTLLGLLSAHRDNNPELAVFTGDLVKRRPMKFILVTANDHAEFKRLAIRLTDRIKQNLAFMDGSVQVISEQTHPTTSDWSFCRTTP